MNPIFVKTNKSAAITWINPHQVRKFIFNPSNDKSCIIWTDGKTEYFSGKEARQIASFLFPKLECTNEDS